LTEPDLTIYTFQSSVAAPASGQVIGTPVRLMARAGALESVTVLDQADEPEAGVWISRWFAERYELGVGDTLELEAGFVGDVAFNDTVPGQGENAVAPITAVYQEVWNQEGSAPTGYWAEVPPVVVPRFIRAFGGPTTSLMLADFDVLADSGVTGVVRWRADVRSVPTTLSDLRTVESHYRQLETALVSDDPLALAAAELAAVEGRTAEFLTGYYDMVDRAERAARRVGDPMRSGLTLGLALSLTVMVAVGFFLVERRTSEFRLLASDGDRWIRLSVRVAAQSILPGVVGIGVGMMLGLALVRWFGPAQRWATNEVPWPSVAGILILAVVGTALVAGVVGQSLVSGPEFGSQTRSRTARAVAFLALLGAVALLWIQAGERRSGIDSASLALPVVAFLLSTAVFLAATRALLSRLRPPSARRRPGTLLAWQRISNGARPIGLATMAVGVGFGLVVSSVALVATFDRNLDAKLATQIGATTRWTVSAPLPDDLTLPAQTAWIHHQDTRVAPGGVVTRVVAVEEADFRSAVSWHEEFGLDVDQVAELLRSDVGSAIPAIAIAGEGLPTVGGVGTTRSFPYQVVQRVESLPLAGEFGATLLISADRLNEMGRTRYDRQLEDLEAERDVAVTVARAQAAAAGEEFDEQQFRSSLPSLPIFVPPTDQYRHHLVSMLSDAELEAAIDTQMNVRERISAAGLRADPNLVATRFGYEYVRIVGLVAIAVAIAAVLLYLASRRRTAALSSLMSRSMGVKPVWLLASTGVEVGVMLAIGIAGATLAAPPVIDRLADRFDPLPSVPPGVDAVFGWWTIVGSGLGLVLLAVLSAVVVEWRDMRRPIHEVLRDVR
jgi:hypothetical protein